MPKIKGFSWAYTWAYTWAYSQKNGVYAQNDRIKKQKHRKNMQKYFLN